MTPRVRRLVVLVVFVTASTAIVATTPAYTLLGSEHSEVISLTPADPAALRSFGIALSAAALPDLDELLASRTYGQVVVAITADAPGVEIAVPTNGTQAAPIFEPAAGDHVVFDAGDCDPAHDCRRGVDVVLRLAEGAAAVDVDLMIRSRVYYPASSLPEDAELSYTGLDASARSVTIHDVEAEVSGEAQLDPTRPLDITIRYTPAGGTVLRLHGGQLAGTYDPGVAPASGASPAGESVLGVGVYRGTNVETLALAPLENLAQPIVPIAACLATCELTYRLVLTPSPPTTSPTAKLTWRANAWVFVLTEPSGSPPRLEMEAVQAPAGG
jgi:hypothetical protein